MAAELIEYGSPDAWVAGAVQPLTRAIADALEDRDEVCIALPGGRSPAPILERLAVEPLPWERIIAIPTDERLVPDDHPARNLGFLARNLATAVAHGLKLESLGPTPGPLVPPDVVFLGFGEDRHIASLFPGSVPASTLDPEGAGEVVVVTPDPLPPDAPYPRLSLSMGAIARARHVVVAASGTGKRRALGEALAERPAWSPLGILLAQDRVSVVVCIG